MQKKTAPGAKERLAKLSPQERDKLKAAAQALLKLTPSKRKQAMQAAGIKVSD